MREAFDRIAKNADGGWDKSQYPNERWIDGMFMITAVQVQAYRATGDRRDLDPTTKAMVSCRR